MNDRIISRQTGFDAKYKTWHTNGKNMIIYMHSDGGSIVCNEKLYPIENGGLCFIGAKKYHYTMPDSSDSYERSKIFTNETELNGVISLFSESCEWRNLFNDSSFVYARIPESKREAVISLFEDMALHSGDDNASDMIFTSCIIRLLVFISQYKVDAITPPKSSVQKAIDYINANIRYDVTIDGVCEYTHTSKYHFCRSFKRATGLTVMEYILKTRIILAKTLLESKTLSIGEISDTCGFSSVSYFCRVFKEHTSQTPLQYKKQK